MERILQFIDRKIPAAFYINLQSSSLLSISGISVFAVYSTIMGTKYRIKKDDVT
jgi:hypothetical protein